MSSKGDSVPLLKILNISGRAQPPYEESVFLLLLITRPDITTKGALPVITLSLHCTFFYKKKVYKKMRLKWLKSLENLKKITRLNFQNLVYLLAKDRYFVVIAFKMLKMEFKFRYTMLITKVSAILASLF